MEMHLAVDQSEQRIVRGPADIFTGMNPGTALANDDAARSDHLAIVPLHAEKLRIAIPAVARAADTLFMCHDIVLLKSDLQSDRFNLDGRAVLAMAVGAAIAFTALFLENDNLIVPGLVDDFALHGSAFQNRRANAHVGAVGHQQNLIERNGLSDFAVQLLRFDGLIFFDAKLLPRDIHERVHQRTPD
jgi:hypothetical protein